MVQSQVVLALEDQRNALLLARVQRSIRWVATTPLPKAPAILLCIVDLREFFHLPARGLTELDRLAVQVVRDALHAVIGPLNGAAAVIDRIAKEEIPRPTAVKCGGDFDALKNNLNQMIS
ncbi:MAG: hypothetical protein JW751_16320 [Polyangiaceae bacterium]|nr:hypothetical protein [Polyangiaceae bacterium]